MREFLHLVQQRLAPLSVEFARLRLEQRVDVGIAAIDVSAALGDESLEPRRSVAVGAARAQDDVLQALVAVRAVESRALERPQLGADAHGAKIVENRLGVFGEG